MTEDLHARLLAAVRQRMETARRAADEPLAWHHPYTCWTGLTARVVAHVITNDPATILRHCERDLKVLERHRHVPNGGWCGGDIYVGQPCDEITDLAAAYGIEVDG